MTAAYVRPNSRGPCAYSKCADHGLTTLRAPDVLLREHKSVLHLFSLVHVDPEEGRVEPEEARSRVAEAASVFADPLAQCCSSSSSNIRDTIRIISARRVTSHGGSAMKKATRKKLAGHRARRCARCPL